MIKKWKCLYYELISEGRSNAHGEQDSEEHRFVKYRITQLRIKEQRRKSILPVAGLPVHLNELYIVSKAKKRPALILPNSTAPITSGLIKHKPS